VLKTRGFAIALAAVVSHGSKYLFRLIAASRERRPIFPFLQLSAFRHNGHDFSEDEFRSPCRFGFSNKRRTSPSGSGDPNWIRAYADEYLNLADSIRPCQPSMADYSLLFRRKRSRDSGGSLECSQSQPSHPSFGRRRWISRASFFHYTCRSWRPDSIPVSVYLQNQGCRRERSSWRLVSAL